MPRATRTAAAPRLFRRGRTARLRGKAFGKLLARRLRARSCRRAPRARPQRLKRFSSSGAIGGRSARGGRASIAPMVTPRRLSPSIRSEAGIETGRKVARDQCRVALRQIDADEARHGGAIRIDGDASIDERTSMSAGESRTDRQRKSTRRQQAKWQMNVAWRLPLPEVAPALWNRSNSGLRWARFRRLSWQDRGPFLFPSPREAGRRWRAPTRCEPDEGPA